MITIYIAENGKPFDCAWDCEIYEWKLHHKRLDDVKIFDKDGNELKDISLDDTYNDAYKVIVPDEEAAEQVHDAAEYYGWCSMETIDAPGTWGYRERDHYWDGEFVKEQDG